MLRLLALIPALLLPAGCSQTLTVEVDTGANDDALSTITRYLPQPFGLVLATIEPARVGGSVSGVGDTLLARTLFRFNAADRRRVGDMTLHLYCDSASGQPGPVDVCIVDDFGELPDVTQPEDIGAI